MTHTYNKQGDYFSHSLRWHWHGLSSIKGLLLITLIMYSYSNSAHAMTQSHQGSAFTNEFILNASLPNARIQISKSNAVHIINVDPPGIPSATGLEEVQWKVSLELLALQLCEPADGFTGDRLKVVYSDPTTIKSTTWKQNASYPQFGTLDRDGSSDTIDEYERELDNILVNQIVLIPEGRWILSGADLVATLYQDPLSNGTCQDDTFPCSCSNTLHESGAAETVRQSPIDAIRCIPKSLVCNGQPNCGYGCIDDESESICAGTLPPPTSPISSSCKPPEITSTTTKPPSLGNSGGSRRTDPSATITVLGITAIVMIFMNRLL